MGTIPSITSKAWISNRLPSFSLGEINVAFFLNCKGLAEDAVFSDVTKEQTYAAYAESIKKLFVAFSSVSEEGASVSIDIKYYEQEYEIFKKFLPSEQQDGEDIINAGNWN